MNDPVVIFIHNVKAAGTTIRDVLEREYGKVRVRRVDGYRCIEEVAAVRSLEFRAPGLIAAYRGHMPFGLDAYIPRACAYVTLVRDPVARLASHYRWVLRTPSAQLHSEFARDRLSLQDYVARSSGARFFNNGQTRLLGGSILAPDDVADEAMLHRALERLEAFAVVGLVERFDESIDLMRQRFGWLRQPYERLNTSPPAPEIADADREAILERNQLDSRLHQWASERFDRQLAAKAAA
jgi:Galactose-3-O-sulfotransferase